MKLSVLEKNDLSGLSRNEGFVTIELFGFPAIVMTEDLWDQIIYMNNVMLDNGLKESKYDRSRY